MPHTNECRAEVRQVLAEIGYPRRSEGFYCAGRGCTFTRDDVPDLWDLLRGNQKEDEVRERRMPKFEVTEDHLKLVKRMYWQWDDGAYDGAPAVGLKRPYGNSDVMMDVVEILGWDAGWDDYDRDRFYDEDTELHDKAMKLHREMETVLQIATCTLSWEPGTYVKRTEYDALSWERED